MSQVESSSGTVHGRAIELDVQPPFSEGDRVRVLMIAEGAPGAGLLASFGACADEAEELDEFVRWTYEQRALDRPEIDE